LVSHVCRHVNNHDIDPLFNHDEWQKYEHINQHTHDKQQLNSIHLQYLAIEQEFVELFCPLEAIQWACVCSVFN
jgi:hypothetical protein